MTSLVQSLAQHPAVETIGWVLLHFLWQGAVVTGLAAATLRLLAGQRAEVRYAVACGALALMLAMPLATFVLLFEPAAAPGAAVGLGAGSTLDLLQHVDLIAGVEQWQLRAETFLPMVVIVWAIGVVFLSLRLITGLVTIEMLARKTTALPAALMSSARGIADRLGLSVAVRFALSPSIDVPTVIGWVRPVVLVPASAITGLTPAQLETLLAHELAHIRRYDYFVNLVQSVVETALFYHPGVWWISKRIRAERENCCDDIVVELYADPLLYARALTDLESLRALPAGVALAATGGSLRERVLRLITAPEGRCSQRGRASLLILVMTTMMLLVPMSLLGREVARHASKLQSLTSLSAGQAAGMVIDVLADAITPRTPAYAAPARDRKLDLIVDFEDEELLVAMASAAAEIDVTPADAPSAKDREIDREIDRAIQKKIFGITDDYRAALRRAGYELTDEQLVEFRIHDVTPAFIDSMNAAGFGRLSSRQILESRIHGLTPEYIAAMRHVLPEQLLLPQLMEFRIHGVTGEYIRSMNATGFGTLTPKQLVEMKIHGVTAEFIERMNRSMGGKLTVREILEMSIHGVSPETIRTARELFGDVMPRDVVAMQIHGVTPEFIHDLRERGYAIRSLSKAAELKVHSVTPQFIDSVRAAGYANVPLDQLVQMRIFGVDAEFLRRLKAEGLDLTIDQMIRLRIAGIDPSELSRRR